MTQTFGNGDPLGHYYDAILYIGMNYGSREHNTDAAGTMAVSPQEFETGTIHLQRKGNCSDNANDDVWLVSANMNCPRYISYPSYVPEELKRNPFDLSKSLISNVFIQEKSDD